MDSQNQSKTRVQIGRNELIANQTGVKFNVCLMLGPFAILAILQCLHNNVRLHRFYVRAAAPMRYVQRAYPYANNLERFD